MISGGGTGGHIYPAIAIANAWKENFPDSKILFVGAKGKMEMQKVPEAGFKIVGLKIAGWQRNSMLSNLAFPFKVLGSLVRANRLIRKFRPQVVVGVGGYASGPLLMAAQLKGIPTLIQEQNSHAGITNKLLAKRTKTICVAYPDMDKFFPKEKILYTGNPVRRDILDVGGKREEALAHFGLDRHKPVILVLGGSLGARSINMAILKNMAHFEKTGYQVLWQTGKFYFEEMKGEVEKSGLKQIFPMEYIREMDLAYAAADLIISRAGALSVSELSLVGKPVVFIPSPNVAEDHQTKNAMVYLQQNAAKMLKDAEVENTLAPMVEELFHEEEMRKELGRNIKKLAKPDAVNEIINALKKLIP